jgi:lysozyme family protein
MQAFERAIAHLLPIEGGYVNDPADSGGETNFGITVAVARAFGYMGPMRDMTRSNAARIYQERFWSALGLETIESLSVPIAEELFDSAVNVSPERAAKWLQRSLNVLNNRAAMYRDIAADGRVGPMTILALREYLQARGKEGERVLVRMLNALQGAFYVELAEARDKDERFVYGWFANRVVVA